MLWAQKRGYGRPERKKRSQNFNISSGFTDEINQSVPKLAAIIGYRFQDLTRDIVSRFPFVGIAIDIDEPKDAVIFERQKAEPGVDSEVI
ncbi:hypothetical protein GALMADRAFT_220256 [Galerina marginata CBS 339.88]|uniref:DNA ligase OB-like domain-containing protein n=1 Tax=Galerina marginata (strain CBS 339.88) TaxID=685588 RepID=A0A067TN18_GALM3|nr:hypothetical protein GALMADRAFT_220256 [Galerina marginata CBS 339.88]